VTLPPITYEKWAAILSTGAALLVVLATFYQWWDITYDGGMLLRRRVRLLLLGVAALFVFALYLLVVADP
jgi:hypothetical protein